jgi:hypothetical protein
MEDNQTVEIGDKKPQGNDPLKIDALHKIISLRNISKVIPIISNSFRIEQVFRDEQKITNLIASEPEYDDEDLTIEEQLTKIWAERIYYPMTDNHNLARVAQYHQVENDGSDVAKEEYLEFLNSYLLEINADEKGYDGIVKELKKESQTRPFSEIVRMLDYPRFSQGKEDPLMLLAKLPFPIYITTSYHDFLERALLVEKKEPRTQVIFWEEGRVYDDAVNHYPDPNFIPTTQNPAVYHIFGLESYPGSLVLSEDDYMRFLVSVVADTDTQKPIVPPRLRQALASSHLLLLGYHLRDWDFRVLFRFILNYRRGESAKQGIFIQLKPRRNDQHLLDYLKHYFNMQRFEIDWKSIESFIQELWTVYKGQQP